MIVSFLGFDQSGAGSTGRTSVVNTKAALLVAEKGRTEKLHYIGSEDHLLRSESFSEVQPSLHDFPVERNPASVAPSPTHPNSLETVCVYAVTMSNISCIFLQAHYDFSFCDSDHATMSFCRMLDIMLQICSKVMCLLTYPYLDLVLG